MILWLMSIAWPASIGWYKNIRSWARSIRTMRHVAMGLMGLWLVTLRSHRRSGGYEGVMGYKRVMWYRKRLLLRMRRPCSWHVMWQGTTMKHHHVGHARHTRCARHTGMSNTNHHARRSMRRVIGLCTWLRMPQRHIVASLGLSRIVSLFPFAIFLRLRTKFIGS